MKSIEELRETLGTVYVNQNTMTIIIGRALDELEAARDVISEVEIQRRHMDKTGASFNEDALRHALKKYNEVVSENIRF